MSEHDIVLIAHHWHERQNELTYIARSVGGALSRWNDVSVAAPGPLGHIEPDGAFDVLAMGMNGGYRWPDGLTSSGVVVVDDLTSEIAELLSGISPHTVFYLAAGADIHDPTWRRIPLVKDEGEARPWAKVYVPVNPLAELHHHNGFGFTGYQLVLSGPTGTHEDPPSAVAWLTAAFHDSYVVVIENAVASAWKGRGLRGRVSVDTRMDLWRLIAHANVCVDLAPCPHIARECIEALRFGTPIIVPENSGAAVSHALASGGSTYGDPEELLKAVAAMQIETTRSTASRIGRLYANANHGKPTEFMDSLRTLFSGT